MNKVIKKIPRISQDFALEISNKFHYLFSEISRAAPV
jgi:hypothetical protein